MCYEPTMKYFSTYNVESYFFLRLIYLIKFLSLSLSLSARLSGYLTLSSVFIARVKRYTWTRCEMHTADLFLRASRITTSFPRVCTDGDARRDGVTERRPGGKWCRTCYTRVHERHVPLGTASRLRLMFQRTVSGEAALLLFTLSSRSQQN